MLICKSYQVSLGAHIHLVDNTVDLDELGVAGYPLKETLHSKHPAISLLDFDSDGYPGFKEKSNEETDATENDALVTTTTDDIGHNHDATENHEDYHDSTQNDQYYNNDLPNGMNLPGTVHDNDDGYEVFIGELNGYEFRNTSGKKWKKLQRMSQNVVEADTGSREVLTSKGMKFSIPHPHRTLLKQLFAGQLGFTHMAMMFYGYCVGTPAAGHRGRLGLGRGDASWAHVNGRRLPGRGPVLHGDRSSVLAWGSWSRFNL